MVRYLSFYHLIFISEGRRVVDFNKNVKTSSREKWKDSVRLEWQKYSRDKNYSKGAIVSLHEHILKCDRNSLYGRSRLHHCTGVQNTANYFVPCSTGTLLVCNFRVTILPHPNKQALWVLTHWGRDTMAAISQTTLSNPFSLMKIYKFSLRFHCSLFPRVQLSIFRHWFR